MAGMKEDCQTNSTANSASSRVRSTSPIQRKLTPLLNDAPTLPSANLYNYPCLEGTSEVYRTDPSFRLAPTDRDQPTLISPEAKTVPQAGTEEVAQQRRGLINLGNTCYINAALQVLFHSAELCNGVLATRPAPSQPHLAALQQAFAFLAFSERPTYSPADFHQVALPPWFEGGRQHDCSEFINYLLNKIDEESQDPASSETVCSEPPSSPLPVRAAAVLHATDDTNMPGSATVDQSQSPHPSCRASPARGDVQQRSKARLTNLNSGKASRAATKSFSEGGESSADLVRQLLASRVETTYTCQECRFVSRKVDIISELHLALPDVDTQSPNAPSNLQTDVTVADLVQHYLAPERLTGDNRYRCSECAGLRDADRQMRLLTAPPHLVVSLVRFGFDQRKGERRKVMTPVRLTERLLVPLADHPPAQYSLYAVIVHAGYSLDTGHYYAFCRSTRDEDCSGLDSVNSCWWRLDDSHAVPVLASTVLGRPRHLTQTAYMMLYRQEASGEASSRPPQLSALPGPLRAAVNRDNALYRRERQLQPTSR